LFTGDPFVAAGFNYSYYLPKESRRLETLFSPNDVKFKELFAEDYEIGGMYVSILRSLL
jgi:hypothetical protein